MANQPSFIDNYDVHTSKHSDGLSRKWQTGAVDMLYAMYNQNSLFCPHLAVISHLPGWVQSQNLFPCRCAMFGSWTRLTDAPFARVNHQAIILNDSLYVFGGFSAQRREFDHSSSQIDVFRWDIHHQIWVDLKYPLRLKTWNCSFKSWGSDPLPSDDGSIHPTHRFGHTVVAWRGRGWLFGGRNHRQLCSNHVYMFEPGCLSSSELDVVATNETRSILSATQTENSPHWALINGIKGSLPTPRDGHAAAVLEDSMFIFGGYEDEYGSYDNQVYRLDFHYWSWTRIQIHAPPPPAAGLCSTSSVYSSSEHERQLRNRDVEHSSDYVVSQDHSPLPRDFACLIAHQGRLFVFGGRSECSDRSGYDVYDSAIWELIPISVKRDNWTTAGSTADVPDDFSVSFSPSECKSCTTQRLAEASAYGDLLKMTWEEETGNWASPEFWAVSPPRPCCLWRLLCPIDKSSIGQFPEGTNNYSRHLSSTNVSSSRWATGRATWVRLHPGHGLQLPDDLLPRLFESAAHSRNTKNLSSLPSPYGRRSLSSWAFQGQLYIGFGTVRCQTRESWQLHYHDIWRFDLADNTWSVVETLKCSERIHLPTARRRAVASLYIPRPSRSIAADGYSASSAFRPQVFLFGGTQPRLLYKTTATDVGSLFRRTASIRQHTTRQFAVSEPVSQNRMLHLVDGDTVSLSMYPSGVARTSVGSNDHISCPIVILVVGYPRRQTSEYSDTLFHLFLVLPSTSTSIMANSSTLGCNYPATSLIICVISWSDLTILFSRTNVEPTPTVFDSHGLLDRLLCNADTDSGIDRVQIYNALRCSWLTFETCSMQTSPERNTDDGHRLRIFVIRSPEASTTLVSEAGLQTGRTASSSRGDSYLLMRQSYKLYISGLVYPDLSDCVRTSEWCMIAPWVTSVLVSSISLLIQSMDQIVNLGHDLSSYEPLISKRSLLSVTGHFDAQLWIDSAQLTLPTPLPSIRSLPIEVPPEADTKPPSMALFLQQVLPQLRDVLESGFSVVSPISFSRSTQPASLGTEQLDSQSLRKARRPSLHNPHLWEPNNWVAKV
ncbi:kelch domain-containing protein 3 [Clonorchis sinensis]|uniref:Kelch domain-containing protein 3 n=1 Tax=Clonorchis sinensis TaxID=79923 RepID=A0A3R7DJE8_CLOSI|nr:kelch domain-containing protein 3 [Clonorchis sinensis]